MSRTIAVTGAASGLGKATAERLEADGNRVIRLDLREGDVTVDLATREGREEGTARLRELAGPSLDGMITWAGVAGPTRATLLVNYFGTVDLLAGVRDLLAAASAPRVVVTSSRMSLYPADANIVEALLAHDIDAVEQMAEAEPEPNAYYTATKTALARWMRRIAVDPEWGGQGIRVNAIAPGLIETPMTAGALADPGMAPTMLAMHPQVDPTLNKATEMADLAAFLLDPRNTLLVGQCLWADRGTEAIERGDGVW